MKQVAIVLVNWNGISDTEVALVSIQQMDKHIAEVETIVVDNGSTNNSVDMIHKTFPWVTLIETGKNLGFTGGNNIGIKHAIQKGADYIWLLNNDTIVDRNALQLMYAFKDTKVGIAGSKIYFAPGHEYHKERYTKDSQGKVLWFAGGIVDWHNMYASHKGVDEIDRGQYNTPIDTDYITGCSMMIKREVVDRIGILDDAYYLYLEDLDYCLRAKRAGFLLRYYPESIIWHVNAGSSGGAGNVLHEYYQTRNRFIVGIRYASMRTKFALLRESIRFVISGSTIKQKAIWDAVLGRWGNQYDPKKILS